MFRSVTLGRLMNIEVKLHPSFGLIGVWIVANWSLAEHSTFGRLLYSCLLALILFGFVLLHEFGHSLMAREYGLAVRDITLVPFGGIARIEQLPDSAKMETKVAIAGPAINLAAAMVAVPLVLLTWVVSRPAGLADWIGSTLTQPSAGALVSYIFLANLLLCLFNLLPAFPMDGGRILRAGLSRPFGRERATTFAVAIGAAMAFMLLIAGVWMRDIILPVFALFLLVAAWAEGRSVRLETSLKGMRIGPFAVWDRGGIAPGDPITLALRGGLRDVVVTKAGKVEGIVWRNDLLYALNTGGINQPVSNIMDKGIASATINDSVFDVHKLMVQHQQYAIPIVEGEVYRGVFTSDRFAQLHKQLKSQTAENRHLGRLGENAKLAWRQILQ